MNGSSGVAAAAAPTPTAYPSHAQHGYTAVQHSPQATAAAALSEGETSTNGSKRRKASGAPGSRGVANLTPEQLVKKRANDREAQRAIRERTRNTIANLERRIKELESQQPFQELQRVISERDNALRECDELRHRLATVAQVVGTAAAANNNGGQQAGQQVAPVSLTGTFTIDDLIDPTWLNPDGAELAALTAQQAPLPPHPSQQQQHAGPQGQYYDQHVHPDLRSPSYATTHGSPASTHTDGVSMRKWSPGPSAHTSHYSQPNGVQYEQQVPAPAPLQQSSNGERDRLGLNYIMDRSSPNGHPAAPAYSQPPQQQQAPPSPPLYARLPSNTPPSCPLDSLLNDFIASRRQQINAGASMQEVLGPEYPSFTALHDPSSPALKNCHPVSALLIDILSKFPDISALPERVAVLYMMFLVMRWFICPCEACYERLPEWVRPVAEQLERPHATWVDDLPWSVSTPPPSQEEDFDFDLFCNLPAEEWSAKTTEMKKMTGEQFANTFFRPFLRKRLAASSTPVKFDEFFVPYTTTLSLNWPYPVEQVLIPTTTEDGSAVNLNPVFETHLRKLGNWSLGVDFQHAFPDLVSEEVRMHSTKG